MKRQLPLLIVMAVLGAAAYFSLNRVQFSASIYELLPRDLPEVRGMDWLNRYFNRDGQLIVTVSSPSANLTTETAHDLATELKNSPNLVAAVYEEMPLDRLAREGGSLLAWLWFNADPREVEPLANRLQPPQSAELAAEAMLMIQEGLFDEQSMIRSYDPLALTRLPDRLRSLDAAEADAMASRDGKFRVFYVEGNGVDFSNYREAAAWLDQMKSRVGEWRQSRNLPDSISIGLTGTPAFMAEVGSEMERDMTLSVMATMALISLLFWIMHRQSQPLGWLIAALCLILILTINLGGLFFGDLSVMSAGFAAILLGLAVDYGIVIYREAMSGEAEPAKLRKRVGRAIAWAALTTAVVFLSLNFSSLPGIAEMGNLVAIGIGLGAIIMLYGYSRIAVTFAGQARSATADFQVFGERFHSRKTAWITALAIPLVAGISILVKELPGLEAQFHPFRIRSSPSVSTWQEMQTRLRGGESPTPVVVTAASIDRLLENIESLRGTLENAKQDGLINRYILPTGILPDPSHQNRNRELLKDAVDQSDRILEELDSEGFSEDGIALTREVLETWKYFVENRETSAPYGRFAEWTVGRLFTSVDDNEFAALGSINPSENGKRDWVEAVCDENTAVASLSTLGTALNLRIKHDLRSVFLPLIGVLTIMLAIVFRNWKDWALALFSLFFSACAMVLVTLWTPLSWNSFNICGLPLLFGTGLDFGIHMIFALRRSNGYLPKVRQGISKALIFCGVSSAIGFGSLAFASAQGLASLGQICAAGILINMVVAVWFLPRWYRAMHRID